MKFVQFYGRILWTLDLGSGLLKTQKDLKMCLRCTEGHDAEISGAIFGCLLLEQVATFGEYFCRFLRPAVAGRRKEKFYHHHNSKVLRSIFGLVSVMALILRLLPLPSLKGHNSAPWSLIDLNPFPRARPLPGLGARHWKCSKSPFLARVIRVQSNNKKRENA